MSDPLRARVEQIRNSLHKYFAAHPEDRGVSWPALARELLTEVDRLAALLAVPERPETPETYHAYEEHIIEHCVIHWFTQGGVTQFGALGSHSLNADGLIAAILRVVRAELAERPQEPWQPKPVEKLAAAFATEYLTGHYRPLSTRVDEQQAFDQLKVVLLAFAASILPLAPAPPAQQLTKRSDLPDV